MVVQPKDVRRYITIDGRVPFAEWFDALRDTKAKSIIDKGILGLTNSEAYSSGYYLELIAKKRDELLSVVEPQGDVGKQLSLF